MSSVILQCRNCTFGYDRSRSVLSAVSFELRAGEFTALLGPNGAGKSTLLKCILNRIRPQEGVIELDGTSVHAMSSRKIAELIGFVDQSPPQTAMSVVEYVLLGAVSQFSRSRFWFTAEEKSRCEELLCDLGIVHLRDHRLDQISGGEQQLAQIARALMSSPRVLLLDEPVSHLDIQHIETVVSLLLRLKKERNIAIFSSFHDIHLAASCCDQLCILDGSGRVETVQKPEDLTPKTVERVFSASFDTAVFEKNSKKVVLPSYRFR